MQFYQIVDIRSKKIVDEAHYTSKSGVRQIRKLEKTQGLMWLALRKSIERELPLIQRRNKQ